MIEKNARIFLGVEIINKSQDELTIYAIILNL